LVLQLQYRSALPYGAAEGKQMDRDADAARQAPPMEGANTAGSEDVQPLTQHSVTVEFDEFGWQSLVEEAERQDVPVEELVLHASMYYLSDLHSGRAAAKIFNRSLRPVRPPRRSPGRGDG
jgi:hypothetical protein